MNYFTVSGEAEAAYEEKRSEFIGRIRHVTTADEAVGFINHVREANRKARHNVYAYILRDGNISRYSDDGEPQGTAGIPVMNVLIKRGLSDVCIVVTRYFGGVLLGANGLVRAYSHTASLACEKAHIMNMCLGRRLVIETGYSQYGKLSSLFPVFGVMTVTSDFGSNVRLEVLVRSESYEEFADKIKDVTNGSATVSVLEESYSDFSACEKNSDV